MTGKQKFKEDQIGLLSKFSSITVQLSPSLVTIGGLQYQTSTLSLSTNVNGVGGLDIGSVANNTMYWVYVVLDSGEPAIVATADFSGPTGFTVYTKVGMFSTGNVGEIVSVDKGVPVIKRLLSGSGTYSTPYGVKYLKIRMVGGGGGGGGNNTAGTNGTNTTFGSLIAGGGQAGPGSGNGGAGGTVTIAYNTIVAIPGSYGSPGRTEQFGNESGGSGGTSPFGGAGGGSAGAINVAPLAATSAEPNSGSGGGGRGGNSGNYAAAGGGSGGYIECLIDNIETSYAYSVGVGGTNGGGAAGNGGSGIIIIEEYYYE